MVRLPGAENVPTISPGGQRAPKLDFSAANLDAVPRAVGEVAGAFTNFANVAGKESLRQSEEVKRKAAEQQSLIDGTAVTRSKLGFDREVGTEWTRIQTGDFAQSDSLDTFDKYLSKRIEESVSSAPKDVSEKARIQLRLQLEERRSDYYRNAQTLHLSQIKANANDAFADSAKVLAGSAFREPGRLNEWLGGLDGSLANFAGALTPDQERDARRSGTAAIVGAAVDSMAARGDVNAAVKLISDPKWDTVFTSDQRASLIGKARAEAEQRQREAKADAQFRVTAAMTDARALAEAGEDWRKVVSPRDIQAAYGEKAGQIVSALNFQTETGQQLKRVALASPEEEQVLLGSAEPEAGVGFAQAVDRRDALAAAVGKKREMLAKDPAAFVLQYIPASKELAEKAFAQGAKQVDVAAYAQASIVEQRRLGVAEASIKPLTTSQANATALAIAAEDTPQKKLAAAIPLLGFGEDRYVRRAIAQTVKAGATEDLAYALEAYRSGNQSGASRIMQASAAEVKMTPESRKDVLPAVADAFSDYADVLTTQAKWTGNPLSAALAINQADLITRMTAITGNARTATADVTGHLKPIMDDGLAAILVPSTTDERALRRGLQAKRSALLTEDIFAALQIPGAPSVVQRYEKAVAEDMRNDAHWVNVGDRLGLALPGGVMLSDKDGRVLTFDPKELVSAPAARLKAAPGMIAPDADPFPGL